MAKLPKVNRMTKTKPVVQLPEAPATTQPVQVKLVPAERCFLDGLVTKKHYESRSAALRAGLGLLMAKHKIDMELDQAIERQRRMHQPRRSRRI